MEMIKITINMAPITKKNHQKIIVNRSTGRPMVMPSEQYRIYERDCGYFLGDWWTGVKETISKPVNIECKFYMPTRRRVDLTNLLEAIDDVLVKYHVLADDNSTIIVGHDFSRVLYDKENPRTEIIITSASEQDMMWLYAEPVDMWQCKRCNCFLDDEYRFCPMCGMKNVRGNHEKR